MNWIERSTVAPAGRAPIAATWLEMAVALLCLWAWANESVGVEADPRSVEHKVREAAPPRQLPAPPCPTQIAPPRVPRYTPRISRR